MAGQRNLLDQRNDLRDNHRINLELHNTVTKEVHRAESILGFFIMLVVLGVVGTIIFGTVQATSHASATAHEREKDRTAKLLKDRAAEEKKIATEKKAPALSTAYRNELETSYGSLEISLMEVEQSRVEAPYMTTEKVDLGYTLSGEKKSTVIKSLTPFDKLPTIKDIAPILNKEMEPILKEREAAAKVEAAKAEEEERKVQESYQKYLNENSK